MNEWSPIDGESPIDTSGLKIKGITNRRELSIVEAQNIRKAITKHLAGKPSRRTASFSYDWCLKLHREMFGVVWSWAGAIRAKNLNLGVPFPLIGQRLAELIDDLSYWPGSAMDLVEQAARLHHRAVSIHPFENGNGRWSRFLANIWLRRHKHAVIVWPEELIGAESAIRAEYLEAIKQGDRGDFDALIDLHRKLVETASTD